MSSYPFTSNPFTNLQNQIDGLQGGTNTFTNLKFINATGTNARIQNLTVGSGSFAVLTAVNMSGSNASFQNLATTTATATTLTATTLTATNLNGAIMSGTLASLQAMAVDGGSAFGGQVTVGYNGQRILGLPGTTSLEILSGDVEIGTSVSSAVTVSGTMNVTGLTTLNTIATTQSALAAVDTTIAYKIPIVVNGTTYYISLTASQ